jgi:hypothetical protein
VEYLFFLTLEKRNAQQVMIFHFKYLFEDNNGLESAVVATILIDSGIHLQI